MSPSRITYSASVALLAAALAHPCSAGASYPGANGRIAYTTIHVTNGGPGVLATHTRRADGRGRTVLGPFSAVSWSASGRRLAAVDRDGLLLAGARGRVVRRIATPAVTPSSTALAPDGRTVAFIQEVPVPGPVDESTPWIWTVRSDGTRLRRLAMGENPRWTPDGAALLFDSVNIGREGHNGVARVRPDGTSMRILIRGRDIGLQDVFLQDVSPDGRHLLLFGDDSRRPGLFIGLFISDLNGGHLRRLLRRAGAGVWSPDGARILTTIATAGQRGTYFIPTHGGRLRRLDRRVLRGLSWQPLG
jgi:Tol biopolymer transport system component